MPAGQAGAKGTRGPQCGQSLPIQGRLRAPTTHAEPVPWPWPSGPVGRVGIVRENTYYRDRLLSGMRPSAVPSTTKDLLMNAFKTRASSLLIVGVLTVGLAACGGNGETTDPPANGNGDAPSEVSVTGTDDLKFEPTSLTAAAGTITVTLTSQDAVEHDFVIEEIGDVEVVYSAAGETNSGTVDLEPGTYTFYCSIPGHRTAGMVGTLTVS